MLGKVAGVIVNAMEILLLNFHVDEMTMMSNRLKYYGDIVNSMLMIGKIAGVIVNARAILIIEFSRWWNGNDEKKIKCWMSMIGKIAGGVMVNAMVISLIEGSQNGNDK